MAARGISFASPLPLAPRTARPWRTEDPSASFSSLPRLRAPCIASFAASGRRIESSVSPHLVLQLHDDARSVALVHRDSHIVDRLLRFDTPIIDATFARFPRAESPQDIRKHPANTVDNRAYLCLLVRADCVRVYAPNGDTYDVTLPFHADRILAVDEQLGGGLVVQRRPLLSGASMATVTATSVAFSPPAVKSSPSIAMRSPLTSSAPPRFFTLAHPLEEVKPIAIMPPGALKRTAPPSSFLSDAALDIVDVCVLPAADNSPNGDDGEEEEEDETTTTRKGLLVCFHQAERRFVVYAMTRHRVQAPAATEHPLLRADATITSPVGGGASFVSPAKARQQQREMAMMEQYFKSHIVPDLCVSLTWTSPSLDTLSENPSTSAMSHSRRAFVVQAGEDDHDDGVVARLGLVDTRYGVLLLKPLATHNSSTLSDRENDLYVLLCQDAVPLSRDSAATRDLVITTRDTPRLLLYSIDRIVAAILLSEPLSVGSRLEACSSTDGFMVQSVGCRGLAWRRYRHPLQLHASSLAERTFDVLRVVLPCKEFTSLRVAVAATSTTQLFSTPADDVDDAAWASLRTVLLSAAERAVNQEQDNESMEHGAAKKARGSPEPTKSEDDDIVASLLASAYASMYQSLHPAVVPSTDLVSSSARPGHVSSSSVSPPLSLSLPLMTMTRVVAALHLLHEDCRLSLSMSHAIVPLSVLLCQLCDRLGFPQVASHYRSQNAVVAAHAKSLAPPSTAPQRSDLRLPFDDEDDSGEGSSAPPDVLLWLRARLQGYASQTPSDGYDFGTSSFQAVSSPTTSYAPPFPRLRSANEWWRTAPVPSPLSRTESVCRVFEILFSADPEDPNNKSVQVTTRLSELMEFLTVEETPPLPLEDLPTGIRFVILEAIRVYREAPPRHISERVCEFIGRRDLSSQATSSSQSSSVFKSGSLIESTRLKAKSSGAPGEEAELSSSPEVADDGLEAFVAAGRQLFPSDQRLKEVARLLRSSRPPSIRVEKHADTSDADHAAQLQAKLLLLCKRAMALGVARGMVTLAGMNVDATAPHHAWRLRVPPLPLAGRVPPSSAPLLLDLSGYAKELTYWPQFHNGCATALQLPSAAVVTRYWIKYHRPSSTNNPGNLDEAYAAHAGVLLGLGLHGHLQCLSMADVYTYLSLSNEFVTVAVLLGMATTAARGRHKRKRRTGGSSSSSSSQRRSRRPQLSGLGGDPSATQGDDSALSTASQSVADVDMDANVDTTQAPTMDHAQTDSSPLPAQASGGPELSLERSVSKMLCLHIPSLLPPPFAEFSVPASTQTAALLGLGLLYQGTGHRLMTELLLTEIARSPASAQFLGTHHPPSSTPAGSTASSSSMPFDQHEGYSLAAGLALGLVLLGRGGATTGDPGLADLGLEEKLYKYIVGGATQPTAASSSSSSGGAGGAGVGGDTSASGSYLYRGRKWKPFGSSGAVGGAGPPRSGGASATFRPPSSAGDRSAWRGEHVHTGVTAPGSALALAFMYLQSGNKSIASQLQVPDTLSLLEYVRPDHLLVRTLASNLVLWDNILPTRSWIDELQIPKQLRDAYLVVQCGEERGGERRHHRGGGAADVQTVCEAYTHIVAGACFSIGLRFAGTQDASARETLRYYVVLFREMKSRTAQLRRGDAVASVTDRVTIERSLSVCAQALALVDAGTGDLETLTLLRSLTLRQRMDGELTYGHHMARSMALGLLCLGGGRATISRPREAIAALVVSLYPMVAMNTADNKYHLQAFRHLYVLAVDTTRYVETVDTTSGKPCSVQIHVWTQSEHDGVETAAVRTTLRTPCLLPELETIHRITVDSDAFYPVDIRLNQSEEEEEEEEKDKALASVWTATRASTGGGSTANDTRVKLLLTESRILLERRLQPTQTLPSSTPVPTIASTSVDQEQRLLLLFTKYFSPRSEPRRHAWWFTRLREAEPLAGTHFSPTRLPTQTSVLFDLYSLLETSRRLDSLAPLWNLKLVTEFHRVHPFAAVDKRSPEATASVRDVVEWLQGHAEEALRDRWRHDAETTLPSLAAAQQTLLHRDLFASIPTQDSVLLSAVLVFFDAPAAVWKQPQDWRRRMQSALRVASRGPFAVDRFLLQAQDHVTTEEQAFWLRVVSFFLFAV